MFQLIGATVGVLIIFILPALMVLLTPKASQHSTLLSEPLILDSNPSSPLRPLPHRRVSTLANKIEAVGLLVVGVIIGVAGVVFTFI